MRRPFLLMIPAMVLLLPASVANSAGLAACAAIEKAVERLGCYDALAREGAGARDDLAVWTLDVTPSRLGDDLTDYLLWTRAVNKGPGPGGVSVNPVLLLHCRQGEMSVVFDFGTFVGGGAVRIEYRIGSGAVRAGDVTVSPDQRRFGVWQRDRAIGFIKALYGQEQLRVRVVPPAGDPLIAAFDLAGLEDAVKPLQAPCGWE